MIKFIELDVSLERNIVPFSKTIQSLYHEWAIDYSGNWNNHDRIFANFNYFSEVGRYINQFF